MPGMRLCVALLFAASLGGCCLTRQLDRAPSDPAILVDVIEASAAATQFRLRLRFYEFTEYPGVIQELRLCDGGTVVEYFETPGGAMSLCQRDTHSQEGATSDVREMFVYPGEVEGTDASAGGFCMLSDNGEGLCTTVGASFNERFQQRHKVQGRVKSANRALGFRWRLNFDHGVLEYEIPAANRLN